MNRTSKPSRRTRRSRAEIEKIIREYRDSGLSQVAFAGERGLNLGTLRKWLAKERLGALVPLREVKVTAEPADRVTIRLPGGIDMEVPEGVDSNWIAKVVRGLRE